MLNSNRARAGERNMRYRLIVAGHKRKVPLDEFKDPRLGCGREINKGYPHPGVYMRLYLFIGQVYYPAIGRKFFYLPGNEER